MIFFVTFVWLVAGSAIGVGYWAVAEWDIAIPFKALFYIALSLATIGWFIPPVWLVKEVIDLNKKRKKKGCDAFWDTSD